MFLRLNQSQTSLIQFLTQTNQSLLNQVRSKEINTLAGLQQSTGVPSTVEDHSDKYLSTDSRELAAWVESMQGMPLGEEISDDDLENFRTGL